MVPSVIFVGMNGSVFCLSGNMVWSSALRGSDFVTLLVEGDVVFAATRGEIFCLDATTGKQLWRNEMPGVASIATATAAFNPTAAEDQRWKDAAAAAAT